jgi:hypothetical protein
VLRLTDHKILRDAVALFPDNQPALTQRDRRKQLAKIDPAKFDKLDDSFYDVPGSDDKKIRQYIEKHRAEFFIPKRS